MSTNITLDMITANFTKRGVKWRYFKTRADALAHNRNNASNNINATPGGFGPLRGLFIHNFASDISDASSLNYLYNGDAGRQLPGPLSQFGLEDDGEWVIIGWGASNHASAGDSKVEATARLDKMPLDRDLEPSAANTKTLLAPFYLGVEILYGKAPTAAQRDSVAKGAAAIMEVFGKGYTGGSIVMHRETHATRSDPVGFKGYEIRQAVNKYLQDWSKPVTPTQKPTDIVLTCNETVVYSRDPLTLTATLKSTKTAGKVRFQYLQGGTTWTNIGTDVALDANGVAKITNNPWYDVTYRCIFLPTDTTNWAQDTSEQVSVKALRAVDVENRLTALEKAAAPPISKNGL